MSASQFKMFFIMLSVVLLLGSAGCTQVYKPDTSTVQRMTQEEARRKLHTLPKLNGESLVLYGPDTKNVVYDIKVMGNKQLVFVVKNQNSVVFQLNEITVNTIAGNKYANISIKYNNKEYALYRIKGSAITFWTGIEDLPLDLAKNFTDAIIFLKNVAIDEDKYESYFEKIVMQSPSKTTKTVLTENARRYKVQAESAIRDKSFYEASDLFREALYIVPWWPEGHFNRALVLSEVGELDLAIIEMKRFIQLAPDAPNIRAAQDKIYDWERKVNKQN